MSSSSFLILDSEPPVVKKIRKVKLFQNQMNGFPSCHVQSKSCRKYADRFDLYSNQYYGFIMLSKAVDWDCRVMLVVRFEKTLEVYPVLEG